MTNKALGRITRLALWFSPAPLVMLAVIAEMPWLKQRNPALADTVAVAAGIFVLGYSLFLGNRESRRLDEVQRAASGFASANGWVWGGFATIVLLMVPQVMNWLVDLVNRLGSHDLTHLLPVRLAFTLAVILVMVMQMLAIVVASIVWQRRMADPGESA